MFISLVHKVLLSARTHIHMPSLGTKLCQLQQEGLGSNLGGNVPGAQNINAL